MATFKLSCTDPKIGEIPLASAALAIGRHPQNDIPIGADEVASRFHCVIEPDPSGGFVVRDLGSRNGTRVNGVRISQSALNAGDVLTVGTHTFNVEEVADRTEILAKRRARAKATGEVEPWAEDLRGAIDALPPKETGMARVGIIDAAGKESVALESDSGGAIAARLLILLCAKSRATDIHAEPKGEVYSIRMRVDGQMVAIVELPNEIGELTAGLIKNACQMQMAGRDAMLDGHFSVKFPDRRVDFRASFSPTVHGQKLVLRSLDPRMAPQSLSDLNLPPYMLDRVRRACESDAGFILACGPTGSGKTTTLYNALREIDRHRRNVITIEDPVEYNVEGVTQIPISKHATFGEVLRSILRQDPDVILVGEIRDEETARTAMQAAMTGHLVFSTVHAKDTIGSVFRLLDLGVEPYLIANSMDLIIAQRLVRLLCEFCKRPVRITPGQATRIGRYLEGKNEVFAATGCARCLRTGFHGRRALFELLDFNQELRDCVLHEPTIGAMRKIIEQGVFTTLQQSGWILASRGMTTLDEIERVTGS